MSKDDTPADDELRPAYDETLQEGGVRGKYAERNPTGTVRHELPPQLTLVEPWQWLEDSGDALVRELKRELNSQRLMYFSAHNRTYGVEQWVSDGTESGTRW